MMDFTQLMQLAQSGFTAILLYQLWTVWQRLNVVTDKLIALTDEFEEYRSEAQNERAQMARMIGDAKNN
jgi:hypothetical protein